MGCRGAGAGPAGVSAGYCVIQSRMIQGCFTATYTGLCRTGGLRPHSLELCPGPGLQNAQTKLKPYRHKRFMVTSCIVSRWATGAKATEQKAKTLGVASSHHTAGPGDRKTLFAWRIPSPYAQRHRPYGAKWAGQEECYGLPEGHGHRAFRMALGSIGEASGRTMYHRAL